MNKTDIITINGTQYDARTGMPITTGITQVQPAKQQPPRTLQSAATMHGGLQRSKTLQRKIAKKHTAMTAPVAAKRTRRSMDIARSPSVHKFAPRPVVEQPTAPTTVVADTPAQPHPVVQRATQTPRTKSRTRTTPQAIQQPPTPNQKPARVLKEEAVAKAFAASQSHAKTRASKKSFTARFPRFFSVASASLAIVLLAGYLTYLNIPTVSIRIAAAQSGINATYPSYKPDGYRLNGPIAYNSDGKVTMNFVANAGPQNFTLTEKKSNWDSTAVLDNYVKPAAGDDYTTHTEAGLTIYIHGAQATWVNRGILYTIDGSAPLSDNQIRRIATSL